LPRVYRFHNLLTPRNIPQNPPRFKERSLSVVWFIAKNADMAALATAYPLDI
jgi:hypothetical protein